jgi:hypothetical protein
VKAKAKVKAEKQAKQIRKVKDRKKLYRVKEKGGHQ